MSAALMDPGKTKVLLPVILRLHCKGYKGYKESPAAPHSGPHWKLKCAASFKLQCVVTSGGQKVPAGTWEL
eukprot:1159208-Pelagomonas_calceolata.AAC.4